MTFELIDERRLRREIVARATDDLRREVGTILSQQYGLTFGEMLEVLELLTNDQRLLCEGKLP